MFSRRNVGEENVAMTVRDVYCPPGTDQEPLSLSVTEDTGPLSGTFSRWKERAAARACTLGRQILANAASVVHLAGALSPQPTCACAFTEMFLECHRARGRATRCEHDSRLTYSAKSLFLYRPKWPYVIRSAISMKTFFSGNQCLPWFKK